MKHNCTHDFSPFSAVKDIRSTMLLSIFAPLLLLLSISAAETDLPSLLIMRRDLDSSQAAPCKAPMIASCVRVEVNFDKIGSPQIVFPTGKVLQRAAGIPGKSNVHSYHGSDGSEALLNIGHLSTDHSCRTLTASISLGDEDRSFKIESCGGSEKCHVLVEESEEHKNAIIDQIEVGDEIIRQLPSFSGEVKAPWENVLPPNPELFRNANHTTKTTLTVMFYYTPEFAAITPDVYGYINMLIEATNMAYINSQIPVELKLFCIQEFVGFTETETPDKMLYDFILHRGSPWATRNTADLSLLVLSSPRGRACGIAILNAWIHTLTFGWVGKNCPTIATAHEVGHMFGAMHNREALPGNALIDPSIGQFEYGNLIEGGYVSIMAYRNKPNYTTRISMFSSPDLVYKGVPTGAPDKDARRAHLERREFLAKIGDESSSCSAPCVDAAPRFLCAASSIVCCRLAKCYRFCLSTCQKCSK